MSISKKLSKIIQEKIAVNRCRIYNLAEKVETVLSKSQCADCGESDSSMLEFDHVRGTKSFAISTAIEKLVTEDSLEAELAKCDVRCRNCHIKRHYPDGHRYLSPEYLEGLVDKSAKAIMKRYGFYL